jgi:hypothetical protein
VVFAHGDSAISYLSRLTGSPLPHGQFITTSLRSTRLDIITGQHLSRVPRGWSYERFQEFGRELRERCQGFGQEQVGT